MSHENPGWVGVQVANPEMSGMFLDSPDGLVTVQRKTVGRLIVREVACGVNLKKEQCCF